MISDLTYKVSVSDNRVFFFYNSGLNTSLLKTISGRSKPVLKPCITTPHLMNNICHNATNSTIIGTTMKCAHPH